MTKHNTSNRVKGCCGVCGIHRGEAWKERAGARAIRRMGVSRARRTRRNTIERHELD